MNYRAFGFASLTGLALFTNNAAAADPDPAAMTTAARDVGRQVDFLQELFGTNDQLSQINGLFQQTMDFQTALIQFRQLVNFRASGEQLATAFDKVDRSLAAILDEVKLLEKDIPALKLVCNRLRQTEHTLHVTVFGGTGAGARPAEALLRQTLAQVANVESLSNNINWVFAGSKLLPDWKRDVAAVQQALTTLQAVEQKKGATAEDVRAQFAETDKAWGKVVQRYSDARPQEKVLAKSFVALVDQGFSRVATLAGIKDRKATVTDGFSD
jgi:hypothetical protein